MKGHVLFLVSEPFLTRARPLSGIFQKQQAEYLKEAGYKVGLLSIYFESFKSFLIPTSPSSQEADFPVVRKSRKYHLPTRFYSKKQIIGGFQSLGEASYKEYQFVHGKPDLIFAHNHVFGGFIAHHLKTKFDLPYIVLEHSSLWVRGMQYDYSNELRQSLSSSAHALAVSTSFAAKLNVQVGSKKVSVLNNVLDRAILKRLEVPGHLGKYDQFTFLSVGSLDTNKNQLSLLKAVHELRYTLSVKLKIAGSGDEERVLRDYVYENNLKDIVQFVGHLDREALFSEFEKCHGLVLTSKVETFGLVLIEAMAFGTPVLATKTFGGLEIVEPETGLLVEIDDQQDLVNGLTEFIRSYPKYDAGFIRDRCLTRFGPKVFLERFDQLYAKSVSIPG